MGPAFVGAEGLRIGPGHWPRGPSAPGPYDGFRAPLKDGLGAPQRPSLGLDSDWVTVAVGALRRAGRAVAAPGKRGRAGSEPQTRITGSGI